MSITGIPELKDSYRQLGPLRFWSLMSGLLIWIVGGASLMMSATWPGHCDHQGRKIVGMIKQLYCSPDLLVGGPLEYGLFLWLWSMPVFVLGFIVYALIKKRRRNSILPLDSSE